MDSRFVIPSALEGTSLIEPLDGLCRIYSRIEDIQNRWIGATPFRCPSGCGFCCEGFEPDVSEVEALFLAAWMIRTGNEALLGMIEANAARSGCVMARTDGEYHCTVYGGRPLICRLFAYAGDRGKDGKARFRLCSKMEGEGIRTLDEKTILERFGLLPPVMGDFASEAETLLPNSAGERTPLRDALPKALAKIKYMIDLNPFSGPKSA